MVSSADGARMSWEEFESHEPPPSSEYIDGRMIVVPPPTLQHQRVCQRLLTALGAVVPPGTEVLLGSGWKPGADAFIPDLIVQSVVDDPIYFTGTPLLVVEVLSTNRSSDLVRKAQKYAAAGAPHYWIVDPRDQVLDAFELRDGAYESSAHLEGDEVGPVPFGGHRVKIDLRALFG